MDITDVRTENVKSILNVLRFSEGLTKKEIAEKSNLSFSTVSSTCNTLKEQNILLEKKVSGNGIGRLPNKLFFRGESFCVLCLNLKIRDFFELAVLDLKNNIRYKQIYNIQHCKNVSQIIDYAYNSWIKISQMPHMQSVQCLAIGIAVPGIYDCQNGILRHCSISFYNNAPIYQLTTDRFRIPCYLDTKSNFCAISMRQNFPNAENFIYLHMSEEISAGIICQGHLLKGQNNHAARISHLPLGNPSRKCLTPGCQNFGCIENEISLYGLLEDYERKTASQHLREKWQQTVMTIQRNPETAQKYLEEKGTYIGKLLRVLITLFDPATVFLGGRGTALFKLMEPYMLTLLSQTVPLSYQQGLQITWDPQSTDTLFLGITQVAYDHWTPLNSENR